MAGRISIWLLFLCFLISLGFNIVLNIFGYLDCDYIDVDDPRHLFQCEEFRLACFDGLPPDRVCNLYNVCCNESMGWFRSFVFRFRHMIHYSLFVTLFLPLPFVYHLGDDSGNSDGV